MVTLALWLFVLPASGQAITYDCVQGSHLSNFETIPGCEGVDHLPDGSSFPFRSNRLGLRDREYPERAAPGVYRVLFFGASQGTEQKGVSMASVITEELRRLEPRLKVELINGSDHGTDLLRVYTRLKLYLDAYHPDAVLLVDDLQSHAMQAVFEYVNAAEYEADGTVRALGPTNFFWPLPMWLSEKVFAVTARFNHKFRGKLIALRMAVRQRLIERGYWPYPLAAGRSPYLDVHLRHLEAFRQRVEATGASFAVLNLYSNKWDPGAVFDAAKREKDADYKAEHLASKLTRGYYLKQSDLRQLDDWLKVNLTTFDVSREFERGNDMRSLYFPNDIHMNETGIRHFGRLLAAELAPWLVLEARKVKTSSK